MKKIWILMAVLTALLFLVACGGEQASESTAEPQATTADDVPVTTTPTTTTAPTTTATPTTPEDPDAWKEKVDFDCLNQGYNETTDKYSIRIVVEDIHGVGQKKADATFAAQHGLFYDEDVYYWGYYPFDIAVYLEDIEAYAKLDEVKSIYSPGLALSDASDAWKNKITWFNRDCWYDAETDKYKIRITVSDIYSVGQETAEAAFAKKTGLEYRPLWMPFFFETWATVEEIEAFAQMEEVEKVYFPSDPNEPIPAWKEKVEWGYDGNYSASSYNEETGKFIIAIIIQDVHNIGQTNAEAAFAEQYGLDYDSDDGRWQILGWRFYIEASKEEIEFYAKLEEVKKIWFASGIDVPVIS